MSAHLDALPQDIPWTSQAPDWLGPPPTLGQLRRQAWMARDRGQESPLTVGLIGVWTLALFLAFLGLGMHLSAAASLLAAASLFSAAVILWRGRRRLLRPLRKRRDTALFESGPWRNDPGVQRYLEGVAEQGRPVLIWDCRHIARVMGAHAERATP